MQNGPSPEIDEVERQIAEQARLQFPPPYAGMSSNPEGFEFHWHQMQYAFNLPDPSAFPPLTTSLSEDDSASVERYIRTCREISSYSLLNHSGGISFSWSQDEGERIEIDNPPMEALRGFSVLFRQIHDDKNASFKVVSMILERAAAQASDSSKALRQDYIRQWRAARRALMQETLNDIASKKIQQALGASGETLDFGRKHTPLELLSLFNYGEYIHWGDKRQSHASIISDPIGHAFTEFQFHMVMIGLSHFYLGYSIMLEHAFPERPKA